MRKVILSILILILCRAVFAGIVIDINTAYNLGMTSRAPEGAAYSGVTLGFGAGYGISIAQFGLRASAIVLILTWQ